MEKIWRAATVKAINAEEREMEVVANSGQLDRMGETLPASSVDSTNFKANPVFLWAHQYDQPPIGKVTALKNDNDALIANVKFADTDRARDIFHLYQGGFLNAVSVGFIGISADPAEKNKPKRWTKAELLEISAVPIPADPRALAREVRMMGLNPEDLDEVKMACPYRRMPLDPEDAEWNGPAEMRMADDPAIWKLMSTWFDAENPDVKQSYKLPHHRAEGGHNTVWRAVSAAMAALMGGRSGVDIPDSDRRAVYNHLVKHYQDFDKEPPEFRSADTSELVLKGTDMEQDAETKAGRVLSKKTRSTVEQAITLLQELLQADAPPEQAPAPQKESLEEFLGHVLDELNKKSIGV